MVWIGTKLRYDDKTDAWTQHIINLAKKVITPEVVPFIRDEARLRKVLDETSSDYLIVFVPDYPNLTSDLIPVFVAGVESGPVEFEYDMHVYLLK